MRNLLLILFAFVLCSCQRDAAETERRVFVESVTSALRKQDKAAFYTLASLDEMEAGEKEASKQVLDEYLKAARKAPFLRVTFGPPEPHKISRPFPNQTYNSDVVGICYMHLDRFGRTMNIPVGIKDGRLRIACIVMKRDASR